MQSYKIIGILNITPDSFSDGGQFLEAQKALMQADKLFEQEADIVDIGGESTKPNAQAISPETEWQRIKIIVEKLCKKYPKKISLDTKNPVTAEKFCQCGGTIINDVSGFQDPKMIDIAVKYKTICIVNHFPGKTVTEVHKRHLRSVSKIAKDLLRKKSELVSAGMAPDNIILDPGIGFGKTMKCNTELLKFGSVLPHEKILIGHSRKRFLGDRRMTPAVNQKASRIAIDYGARFLRVHEPLLYTKSI